MMAKSDEEYHFKESETPLSYTAESPTRPQKDKDFQTRSKRRNILLVLGMLMVFWAIYKFMGLLFSQVKQNKPPTTVQAQIIPQKVPVVQPISPVISPQVQEISSQKNRLNNLESQVVNMQATLSEVNAKLTDLSTQVSNRAGQVSKPPVVHATKKRASLRSKYTSTRHHYKPGGYAYRLQAALPGRAWLMRSDGNTVTVSLGDRISGYGTVILIDPDTGVVQTSSGAIIKYMS
jgi:intracellular multiplication protein IcmG